MKSTHLAWAAACLCLAPGLWATPITIEGNFVRATFNDKGGLSNLFFDATGTRNFGVNDYIAPGVPFEGFGVRANGVLHSNTNESPVVISGTLGGPGGNAGGTATWSGTLAGAYNITHVFSFGNLDQRILISTTITALSALNGVSVSRVVDPDPDRNVHNTSTTINQRGSVSSSLAPSDFVGSSGAVSGLPLGLLYTGGIAHNTGISGTCCGVVDPAFFLAGGNRGDSSTGDHGIGIAFSLGDLGLGESVTWSYAYAMGTSITTLDTGGASTVPEPATTALVATGLLLAGIRQWRSR